MARYFAPIDQPRSQTQEAFTHETRNTKQMRWFFMEVTIPSTHKLVPLWRFTDAARLTSCSWNILTSRQCYLTLSKKQQDLSLLVPFGSH